MGKRKKLGSTLPVKFQLFHDDDPDDENPPIPVVTQDVLDVILEDHGLQGTCPEIVIYDDPIAGELIELQDDSSNVGEGGDLGFCFRFDEDGACIYNLYLDPAVFNVPWTDTFRVEVMIGESITIQPENALFQVK